MSNNDFVLIDRKNKKSKLLKRKTSLYQKIRQFIGRIISFIINIFLEINILDTQSGMKGFINSKELKNINFISKKFFLDVEIIYFMKKNNINPIDCLNKRLDPNLHQAMMEIEDDQKDPGTIVQEIQKGFTIKDRLLRPALVGVSKKRENNNKKNGENIENSENK